MVNSGFKPYRLLLFAAFLLGSTLQCVAQFDIDFSVSPALGPSLTDSPTTAPVTTLSIDLLAPQHVFTYDTTGASISANNLDPTIRADLGGAAAETDTAIRDSSQAGQINPYGAASNRLSTLFSGAGSTTGSGAAPLPAAAANEPAPATGDQPYMDYGQPYGTSTPVTAAASDSAYRSSWGSSEGASASASSFGGRSAASARSGAGSSSDLGTGSSLAQGYQSGSSLASSSQTPAVVDDPYRAQPVSNLGWASPGLTRSQPTANGIPSTRSRLPLTTFGAGSTERFIARPGKTPGGIQDLYAPIPNPAALPTAAGGSQSDAPSFSSRTNVSGDASPFRSFGEADFLQPDILGAAHIDISSNSRRSSSNREQRTSRLGTTNQQKPLETSASHYGLDSNRSSLSRSSRNRSGKHINPYLIDPHLTGDSSPSSTQSR
jgi:hypothetical protein